MSPPNAQYPNSPVHKSTIARRERAMGHENFHHRPDPVREAARGIANELDHGMTGIAADHLRRELMHMPFPSKSALFKKSTISTAKASEPTCTWAASTGKMAYGTTFAFRLLDIMRTTVDAFLTHIRAWTFA
jgi:hypothetical protein